MWLTVGVEMLRFMVLLLLAIGSDGVRNRAIEVNISSTTCSIFSEALVFLQCDYYLVAPNTYRFSNQFIFSKIFQNELVLHIQVDVQQRYSKVARRVMDARVNLCQLQQLMKNALLRTSIAELYASSNFIMQCPFKARQLYKIENFTVSAKNFPLYTPDLNFTSVLDYYDKTLLSARQVTKGFAKVERYGKKYGRKDG